MGMDGKIGEGLESRLQWAISFVESSPPRFIHSVG